MRLFLDKFGPHLALLAAILITTLALTCSAADMPPTAQALIDKADADVAKIRAALAEKLAKVQDAQTKKGDLEGATLIKAKIESLAIPKAAELKGAIRVRSASGVVSAWDNTAPLMVDTAGHTLDFMLNLPMPTTMVFIRARPGYGSERVSWGSTGASGAQNREYAIKVSSPQEAFKLVGTHTGSNDAFQYGPLEYRTTADGTWQPIPPEYIR